MSGAVSVIVTVPPRAPYIREVLEHPRVCGVRLNTVMPKSESSYDQLARLADLTRRANKHLWVDLKCRQIRVDYGRFYEGDKQTPFEYRRLKKHSGKEKVSGKLVAPPWSEIKITHKIKLDTSKPVKCYFSDGADTAHIVDVIDGDRLVMLDGPRRLVGGGESINITHPSLKVQGYLTRSDIGYLKAALAIGVPHIMLSYVETSKDLKAVFDIYPDAKPLAKIESPKGVTWADSEFKNYISREAPARLMAARGDLYVEAGRPDKILQALGAIIRADPEAVCASRFLSSLVKSSSPECSDIMDIAAIIGMGYTTLMLGDEVCFNREVLLLALDIIDAVSKQVVNK